MQSSTPASPLENNQGEYLIAQYASSCRRVMARNGIFVLQKPTVDSAVVGLLDYGTTVTIRDRGKNGWVPISSPVNGYILHTNFLSSCQAAKAATPPDLNFCRKVAANGGLVVRTAPSNNSARVGVIPKGENVVIARGKNGWVPISTPLMGYAQSRYLAYCSR
ncbi:SH3 domain-containing protein [Tolypothrix sp. FACHB-123]|uniref:SH3 domain-containing protein n=1 Tax=Tolypothrix sp. FACHB-123 TaxID=2692868 RepID=UPI001687DAC7|nr:SH3 domain-containing protein [Tolypothrix sp. FACHB-123]MBD2358917.1 SH3 domain-containing protein [Tolypothrix sp. FACHB-123]